MLRIQGASSQLQEILGAAAAHKFLVYFASFEAVEEFLQQLPQIAAPESGQKEKSQGGCPPRLIVFGGQNDEPLQFVLLGGDCRLFGIY